LPNKQSLNDFVKITSDIGNDVISCAEKSIFVGNNIGGNVGGNVGSFIFIIIV
jgi:hypothetical protein